MLRKLLVILPVIIGTLASAAYATSKIVYPQAAVGPLSDGTFQIELRLGNTQADQSWVGRVRLLEQKNLSGMDSIGVRKGDGSQVPFSNGSFDVSLPSGESVLYRITSSRLQVGVLLIEPSGSDLDALSTAFYYRLVDSQGTATDLIAVQGSRESHTGYRVMISTVPSFNVGAAIVSDKGLEDGPGAEPVTVNLKVVLADGSERTGTITLGGQEDLQKALFPGSVIPGLPNSSDVAQLQIQSAEALYVATLAVGAPPEFAGVQIGAAPAAPFVQFPFTGLSVDTQDRAAVVAFFEQAYSASEGVPVGWDGDVASCNPGTSSRAFKEAMLRRINYFRAMAGVPADIVFDPELNEKCQRLALMMVAENRSSHFPDPSWSCYASDGAEAGAKSNLYYQTGSQPPSATSIVDGFIRDPGEGNFAAGHRRWLLYPRQQVMGSGTAQTAQDSANVIWVIGTFASSPLIRSSWPPPGFVPYQVVFPRWSFSFPGADFSAATVAMTRNGQPVSLTLENLSQGFGDNTIVWVPSIVYEAPAADTAYDVTVRGVAVNGSPQEFSYTVTLINPGN
jgi:uncharacterized protein YkwD